MAGSNSSRRWRAPVFQGWCGGFGNWELGAGQKMMWSKGQPGHAQAEDGIHGLSLGLAGLVPFCPYGISEVY
jgi:hypothetical protein